MSPNSTGLITLDDGSSGPTTAWGRLSQTFFRPPPPRANSQAERVDFARMTDDEKRSRIVTVDGNDRKIGIAGSLLGVAISLYANVPYMVSKVSVETTVKPKGTFCSPAVGISHLHYVTATKTCNGIYPASHFVLPLIVELVLAVAIYVTVLIKRRSALAFTMVMTGLAFGNFIVLLPYIAAGGWTMLRAWRAQRYGTPSAKARLTGWVPPPPRGSARRSKATAPRARSRRAKDAESTTKRKAPSANKRYTPKTPPKKKTTPPAPTPGRGA